MASRKVANKRYALEILDRFFGSGFVVVFSRLPPCLGQFSIWRGYAHAAKYAHAVTDADSGVPKHDFG